jgi:hypothetical protein
MRPQSVHDGPPLAPHRDPEAFLPIATNPVAQIDRASPVWGMRRIRL